MGTAVSIAACSSCLAVGGLVGALLARRFRKSNAASVFRLLRNHFAPTPLATVVVTEREFPARVRADLKRSLDQIFGQRAAIKRVTGIRQEDSTFFGMRLTEFLTQETNASSVPLEHEEVDIGEDEPVRCIRNGLWLLEAAGAKIAVLQSQVPGLRDSPKVRFDIAAENNPAGIEFTRDFFKALEVAVKQAESYRGKILSLENTEGYTGESSGITVHKLPGVKRDEVVLPEKTLDLLERNVVRFVAQRKALARFGQSTKKGLLFYGPPGNGKTHTIRYLMTELKGHTTLLITAEQVVRLAEYMALARLLQPTIVVIEDVDLVGRNRSFAAGPCQESLLNQLLNEMDGLKDDTETIFLLTTNRPEELEEALASRPGRVDQVIEFPAPDAAGREKLVRLYSKSLAVSESLVAMIVDRTDGVSASFIKELMRRSLQFRLERNAGEQIELQDVEDALNELVTAGGRLNKRALGFSVDGNRQCC